MNCDVFGFAPFWIEEVAAGVVSGAHIEGAASHPLVGEGLAVLVPGTALGLEGVWLAGADARVPVEFADSNFTR